MYPDPENQYSELYGAGSATLIVISTVTTLLVVGSCPRLNICQENSRSFGPLIGWQELLDPFSDFAQVGTLAVVVDKAPDGCRIYPAHRQAGRGGGGCGVTCHQPRVKHQKSQTS